VANAESNAKNEVLMLALGLKSRVLIPAIHLELILQIPTSTRSEGIPRTKLRITKISEGVLRTEIRYPKSLKPMEVHHHPEVEKKGIKEYLLEGLMIFWNTRSNKIWE